MSVTRQWFQPGDGIAREVITADIQRYLGNDALVKPGEGTGEYQGVHGYWITAYRNLTSQMVADLKLDSQRWRTEVSQGRGSPHARDGKSSKHPDKALVSYQDSRTHQSRQYYGPSDPVPAPAPVAYQSQPPRQQSYAQPSHSQYAQEPAYTYSQPQAGYAAQPASQPYSAPAYNQPQGQIRTAPTYTYSAQPGPGQDPHPQYQQHQDPRYSYSQSSAPPAPQYQVPPQQPSAPPTYYTASDGRQYSNPPPQANHGRRRG